jgi:hypothetical protein
MKLYRFSGRASLFPGCGLLPIDHTVTGNLTELKKLALKWRAAARKAQLEYVVYIEIKITATLLATVLSSENTEHLVESSTRLKTWEHYHDSTT